MKELNPLKEALPKLEADIVLSLGNACKVASRIDEFDLRKLSNPLDYILII